MSASHASVRIRPHASVRLRLALALMAASGFAGLGLQIVWTQQTAIWLGHETAGVLAVLAAFFGGLGIGALALARRIEAAARPGRWYALCELTIGLWAFALVALIAPASRALLAIIGEQPAFAWQWTVAFGGTFLLLAPATIAMGASLPAMERFTSRLQRDGASIAALYAVNTAGAVGGALVTAFWLVPAFGLASAALICAALNIACAIVAFGVLRENAQRVASSDARAGLGTLAFTGLLGIGYEVVAVRALSQVSENTIYTFAMVLAIYLAGTAIGAAWYRRNEARLGADAATRDRLLGALAIACIAGWLVITPGLVVQALLRHWLSGLGGALALEALLALLVVLPATLLMGALFSHLATEARAAGVGFGRAIGVNTLGGAAAPLVCGVLLVPMVGLKFAFLALAAGYFALLAFGTLRRPRVWAGALGVLAFGLITPPLRFIDLPEGGRIVSYRDGALGAVAVVEDGQGVQRLHIDNRSQEGSNATLHADARQAVLPILLHPEPRSVLFLGLGTGVTAMAATRDSRLRVDAVELVPEVVSAAKRFEGVAGGDAARLNAIVADARRFVRASTRRYDVIVSDNFHPARRGSAALYTVEHFAAVRDRLAPNGLFCQWLPLHQLDLATAASIVGAFLAVHPNAYAMLATHSLDTPVIGLVARRDGKRFDAAALRARIADAGRSLRLDELRLESEFALAGSFIAGPLALARFVQGAPINTDDHPVVAYRAPGATYAPSERPRDRLLTLLASVEIAPSDLVGTPIDPAWSARLVAYNRARDRYIAIGREALPYADPKRMLAQVGEPLLALLRTSPDFAPAYEPLLRLAIALAPGNVRASRAILEALIELAPQRPEAGEALARLGAPPG